LKKGNMMENQDMTSTPDEVLVDPVAPKPRRTKLIVGVVALVVLLAGAAFVGGRLLNNQTPQTGGPGGLVMKGGGPGGGQVSVQIVPAKELPETEPDATGLFAQRKDNSIFVTTGNRFMVQVDKNGTVNTQTDGNGQQLEIVVTSDTTIYKNATEMADLKTQPVDGKIQQQVAPGSIDEIGANTIVTAWGERRGDRLFARVLMYSRPGMAK
jgi:hypothetical protein